MTAIDEILKATSHRPWPLPTDAWRYYQEWNNALFLHWRASPHELAKLIPKGVFLDTFNGEAWVSLVAFTMGHIRPRGVPSMPVISDFHEINIRTYVVKDDKSGVYFFSIEAEKYLSCIIAKILSGLPYTKSKISFKGKGNLKDYSGTNVKNKFHFGADFEVSEKPLEPSGLFSWLTERYCLYVGQGGKIFRYETHHKPWELRQVDVSVLKTYYHMGNISLDRKPDLSYFSPGVKVIAWKRKPLTF